MNGMDEYIKNTLLQLFACVRNCLSFARDYLLTIQKFSSSSRNHKETFCNNMSQ
jgi:hypothetical protein